MAGSMCMAAVFLIASSVVQADQCSSGGECKSTNEPQRVVSLLQTNLQMNAFEESVDDAKGGNMDSAPKAKAAAEKEGRSKAKPKAKKAEAKGLAKAKPKKDKQVELAGGSVLNSKSQWISCTFDWNTLSHAHLASAQWFFIPDLQSQLSKRREHLGTGFNPVSLAAQSLVPERLEPLLQVAASMLDEINVNWYLAFGSEIGFLRSEAFIPWDEDVDIVVKKADRIHVCDFIKDGDSETKEYNGLLSAFRSVPDHPEWLMVAYYHMTPEVYCHKVLWIDIETEVAIDMCIDCGDWISGEDKYVPTKSAFFGNVEVKVPEHPFHSSIVTNSFGVSKTERQISMKTHSTGGWACKRYECGAEPPAGTSAASLEDVYSTNTSAMRGPFDFHVDTPTSDHTTAQCSLPRNFDSCSAESVEGLTQVFVRPCQESPWASAAPTLVILSTNQTKKYYVGPWMVEQLQTQ